MSTSLNFPLEVVEPLRYGGVTALVVSISGGKDSQVMLKRLAEAKHEYGWTMPIIAWHANVGRMEHPESEPFCMLEAAKYADDFVVCQKEQDLMDAMHQRAITRPDAPPFPSAACRYCTAGWKRAECDKWIRAAYPSDALVIVAEGMRNQESTSRRKKPDCWERGATAVTLNRNVIDWLPIRTWLLDEVWADIGYTMAELKDIQNRHRAAWDAHQYDICFDIEASFKGHVAYARGNERLSCIYCVLGSINDLQNGWRFHPAQGEEIVGIEHTSGFWFQESRSLESLRV